MFQKIKLFVASRIRYAVGLKIGQLITKLTDIGTAFSGKEYLFAVRFELLTAINTNVCSGN
jgi:hypothetical protein